MFELVHGHHYIKHKDEILDEKLQYFSFPRIREHIQIDQYSNLSLFVGKYDVHYNKFDSFICL